MIGTLVNAGAVAAAGAVGLVVRRHIPPRVEEIVFQALGLVTMLIGVTMALECENILLLVISLVLGAVAGQLLDVDGALKRLSDRVQSRLGGSGEGFTNGFVTATLLFCIGSMSILGPIEEGMGGTPTILYTKSIIDAASALILAAALGAGVIFSAIPILIYEGGLTLLAASLMKYMTDAMVADLTGLGGLLIIGLGFNLLKIKEIRVANLLPALVFIVLFSLF